MLHAFDFLQEFFGNDGDIKAFDTRFSEDIDYRIGPQYPVCHLTNGGFDFGIAEVSSAGFQLAEVRLNCLEEKDLFGLSLWLVVRESVDFRKGHDLIQKAVLIWDCPQSWRQI